jgi:hypothetical protein
MLSDVERKASQRERTRKHREKMKERSAEQVAAAEQRRKEEFISWRVTHRLVSPGEKEPNINAESLEDATQVAREFVIALQQPDIQPEESLLAAERRVMAAWLEIGAPLLNRNTLRFAEETGSIDGFSFDFEKSWVPIEGSDAPIDVASLPVIEIPAAPPAPLAPPVPAVTWDDPALRNYRTPEIDALCKATQSRIDADARRISAKNLQRELEKEKRLGVGYAYDAE